MTYLPQLADTRIVTAPDTLDTESPRIPGGRRLPAVELIEVEREPGRRQSGDFDVRRQCLSDARSWLDC